MLFLYTKDQKTLIDSLKRLSYYQQLKLDFHEIDSFNKLRMNTDVESLMFTDFGLYGKDEIDFWGGFILNSLLNKTINCPILILTSLNDYYLYQHYPVSHLRQNLFIFRMPFLIDDFINAVNNIPTIRTNHLALRERHFNYYYYLSRKLDTNIGGENLHSAKSLTRKPIISEDLRDNWYKRVKLSRSMDNSPLKWKILIIDDEIFNDDRKPFFEFVKSKIYEVLGKGTEIIEMSLFDPSQLTNEFNDLDIVFIDVINSNNAVSHYENLHTVLPFFKHKRYFNTFPIIVMFSHDKRIFTNFYSIKTGADFYLNKGTFYYDVLEAERGSSEFLIEMIAAYFSFRDWNFDIQKYIATEDLYKPYIKDQNGIFTKYLVEKHSGNIELKIKYVFSKLFSHLPNVKGIEIIKVFNNGLSGAFVALVSPIHGDGKYAPRIVKIDIEDKMVNEKYNFDNYVIGKIDNFSGRIEPEICIADEVAAISYTQIGTSHDYQTNISVVDLETLICKALQSKQKFKTLIRHIEFVYSDILEPFHKSITNTTDISKQYHHLLPAFKLNSDDFSFSDEINVVPHSNYEILNFNKDHGVLVIRDSNTFYRFELNIKKYDLVDNVLLRKGKNISINIKENIKSKVITELLHKILIENLFQEYNYSYINDSIKINFNEKFINPFEYYEEIDNHVIKSNIYATNSIIHGDLNTRNLLYSLTTKTLWLIDFAKTGPGHLCLDYTVFEIDLRFRLIIKIICEEMEDKLNTFDFIQRVFEIENNLLNNTFDSFYDKNPNITTLCKIILKIRSLASSLSKISLHEYFISLYYLSLRAINFDSETSLNSDQSKTNCFPYPKIYVYILAGITANEILHKSTNNMTIVEP